MTLRPIATSFACPRTTAHVACRLRAVGLRNSRFRWARRARFHLLLWAAVALGFPGVARGRSADGRVSVDCDRLSAEQAAEVEARVRATLLITEHRTSTVAITCVGRSASVRVQAGALATALELTTPRASLQDELVNAVDQALHELGGRGALAIRAPSRPAAELSRSELPQSELSSRPVPGRAEREAAQGLTSDGRARLANAGPPPLYRPATASERTTAAPLPAFTDPPAPFARFSAAASAESWDGSGAVGAAFGLAHGRATLWYGIVLGGFLAPGVHDAFEVNEWHASLELGWQPAWSPGIEGVLGLGPSLLVATPNGAVTTVSTNLASSWFGELSMRRPLWFGKLALVPVLGARAFLSERRVTLDAREQLGLAGLQPHVSLGLLYRMR